MRHEKFSIRHRIADRHPAIRLGKRDGREPYGHSRPPGNGDERKEPGLRYTLSYRSVRQRIKRKQLPHAAPGTSHYDQRLSGTSSAHLHQGAASLTAQNARRRLQSLGRRIPGSNHSFIYSFLL